MSLSVVPLKLSLGLTPNFTSECEQCLGGVTVSRWSPHVIGIDLSGCVAWPGERSSGTVRRVLCLAATYCYFRVTFRRLCCR